MDKLIGLLIEAILQAKDVDPFLRADICDEAVKLGLMRAETAEPIIWHSISEQSEGE